LLAFSVISSTSFENIATKVKQYITETDVTQWWPEIQHHCPNAKYMLVGTKLDLRSDPTTMENLQQSGRTVVTYEQGLAAARKIGASKGTYLGCYNCDSEICGVLFSDTRRVK
jgi:Ras-related C3 botulinum toxin substrate 1